MPQLFRKRTNTIAKIVVILIPSVLFGLFVMGELIMRSPYETEVGVVLEQPVPFSHKHHVRELNIDCRFCHSLVEKTPFAGIPKSSVCMNCHSQIWADAPMLAPVRESFYKNEPIAWNQVNRLAKYVYFNHSIHIKKGIGCSSCHGAVDQMPLTKKARTFYMKDCLSCHEAPENSIRPIADIYDIDYRVPPDQKRKGRELVKKYHVHKELLMDCNTCHR